MKKKVLLLLLLCISLTTMADGVRCYSLVAWTKNREQVSFPFEDKPIITIEGTQFVVTSSQMTMEYAAADIEKFTLSFTETQEEETGIGLVRNASMKAGCLHLDGLAGNAHIRVFSVNGSMVKQARTDADGITSLSFTDLPQGVYVVQTPARSFKITIK